MSFTAGPIALSAGVPVVENNPGANSGNLSSQAAVIVNLSPYELVVSSGAGATVKVIDPMTRDLVPLDAEAGQQIVIDPLVLGTLVTPTSLSECFVTWYQAGENVPGSYPSAISAGAGPYSAQVALNAPIAGGNNQVFSLASQPAVFRSALVTIQNLAGAQIVAVAVETLITIIALQTYSVVFNGAGTAFFRIPLTPVGGLATMNQTIQVTTPTDNIDVTILLDTVECATPPPLIFGSSAVSSSAPNGVPTVPTGAVKVGIGGGGTVLAAPASGANYLFGADYEIDVTAAGGINLVTGGTSIAALNDNAANAGADHVQLNGYRTTGIVTYTSLGAVGSVILRFAPGP